ncbi:MAG: spore maturation protein, partial [Ketobacter sp.]
QLGAADPTEVFIPILLATSLSTLTGLLAVMLIQKIPFDVVVLAYLGAGAVLMGGFVYWLGLLPAGELGTASQLLANGLLLAVIALFIGYGLWRRVPVYEQFVEGAKEGFETAVKLIPYLVAMLVAIGVFRACGALEYLVALLAEGLEGLGMGSGFAEALPVALMKPFSGSGARALMLDVMNAHGVDSLAGRIAAVMQGSTETTFYVLTVYFGVVGITRIRYALWAGLLCDVVGMVAAIALGLWFFT